MSERIQAPRGTFDVLPQEEAARDGLARAAQRILGAAGYQRLETPIFEATELFARGVGEATDIVRKEMYTFDDGGGRSVTLRPEGTAPVCRAYVEHGMHKLAQPVKLWYLGPFFRREAPQKGRYRQFFQVGAEALGSEDPAVDAEIILLVAELFEALRIHTRLRLSSLGSPEARAAYREQLVAFLRAHSDALSADVRERIELNPLRAFDAKDRGTQAVMADAPRLFGAITPEDREHFDTVTAMLDDAGLTWERDETLVRGLDYYTRTVFEFESPDLGAQSGVGGGGRYDGLVEALGGPPTPGVGFAAGIERMLLAAAQQPDAPPDVDLYVALAKPQYAREGMRIATEVRQAGLNAQVELAGRSLKGQLKHAGPAACSLRCDSGRRGSAAEGHGQRRAARDGDRRGAGGRAARRAAGLRPPRPNLYREAWAGELRADRAGDEVRVAGWVHRRRDHGGLIFIDLRDRSGLLQLVFHPEHAPEAHQRAHRLRSEDVLTAKGTIARRDEANVNPGLATGEIELDVADFELLADAKPPPFPIDEDADVDETLRLRYRALDLRRERMRDAMICRHQVIAAIRDYLGTHDFLDLETPILTRSTPEGARDFIVPARVRPGSFFALPQSPQLFKQLLMIGGFERYYQIARCFRDEDSRADRLPEFTQLDIELSFVEEEDVISLIEGLMPAVFEATGFPGVPAPPYPRLTYDEAMLRYGSDRPDTRFGLEIQDLGEALRSTEFKVFAGALSGGGVVRGLNAGPRELPRSDLDRLTEQAIEWGAKGLVWAFVEEGGALALADRQVPLRRRARGDRQRLDAGPGDVLFIVADRAPVAADVLGLLRLELAERFDLAARDRHDLLWVVDFPMFEQDPRPAPGTRSTIPSPRPRATSTATPAPCARAPTTSCATGRSSAAGRSASTAPTCSARCSSCCASGPRRRRSGSGSCSTRSSTARRRTAGSRSGSTASWRSSPGASRSARSSRSPRRRAASTP